MRFKPRRELRDFENENFVFDTNEQFSLNEKEEKIWSYLVTEKDETLPVIFQIMWFEKSLCISFDTEHTSESVRKKASELALRVRALLRQQTKANIILEQPIIPNFEIYELNTSDEARTNAQAHRLLECLENVTSEETNETIFQVYGKDGKTIGERLQQEDFIALNEKQGFVYELVIQKALATEQREQFMVLMDMFGYGISYKELNGYDEMATIQNLFSSGLLQVEG